MPLCLLMCAAALAVPPSTINHDATQPVVTEAPPELPPDVVTGELSFDARLPAEIRVDGMTVAQLYLAGTFTMRAKVGPHTVLVVTNGNPRTVEVDVPRSGAAVVMIGRTGVTTGKRGREVPEDGGVAPVDLRVAGDQDVLVQIGGERWRVNARGTKAIEVALGVHPISVRSGNGTVVWATGTLELTASGPVVLQLTEGRMPEVSGAGSSFHPGS